METVFEVWDVLLWIATFAIFTVLLGYALIGSIPEEWVRRSTGEGAKGMKGEAPAEQGPAEEGQPVEELYRRAA